MSGPVTYVPKVLTEVTGMEFKAWDGTSIEVKEWLESFMDLEDENNYVIFGPMSDMLIVQNGDFSMTISNGQYVYIDEDGFHVVAKGTFETLYKEAPSA